MNYFKIYAKDEAERQVVQVLQTKKGYAEVRKKYGECEELFDYEAEAAIRAGVPLLKESKTKKLRTDRP